MRTRSERSTYRTSPLGIVVIAMYGEDWNADIEIRVLVVHSRKAAPLFQLILTVLLLQAYEKPGALPSIGSLNNSNCSHFSSSLISSASLNAHRYRLIPQRKLPQQSDSLVHTCPTRSILVKQIAGQKDEVDLGITSDLEDLAEGVDGVLASDGVFLGVAYVVVGGEKDSEAAEGGEGFSSNRGL